MKLVFCTCKSRKVLSEVDLNCLNRKCFFHCYEHLQLLKMIELKEKNYFQSNFPATFSFGRNYYSFFKDLTVSFSARIFGFKCQKTKKSKFNTALQEDHRRYDLVRTSSVLAPKFSMKEMNSIAVHTGVEWPYYSTKHLLKHYARKFEFINVIHGQRH